MVGYGEVLETIVASMYSALLKKKRRRDGDLEKNEGIWEGQVEQELGSGSDGKKIEQSERRIGIIIYLTTRENNGLKT